MVVQFHDGKVLFDSGVVAFDPACCCGGAECGCDATPPAELIVEFSGITGTYCGGDNCNDFNGVPYVVVYDSANCLYSYTIGGNCANVVIVYFEAGSDRIRVVLKTAVAGTLVWIETSVGFPLNCVTELPSDIAWSAPSGFPGCVGSSSICTLSQVP